MPGETPSTLADILAPLRAMRDRLDAQLGELNARRSELQAERRKVVGVLSAAEKSYAPPGPSKRPPQPKGAAGKPSVEKLDQLSTYLQANMNGHDFNVPHLTERNDWLGFSNSYTNGLMNALHERGTIRLVRTGHPELGARTKIWRLTNAK